MKNKIKKNKGERWIQNIYIPAARRELILSLFLHGALSLAKIKNIYIYIIAEYLQFI
jgi:hypothetical protein